MCVRSNTQETSKAEFMQKLSNTEAELKKSLAYKKSVYLIYCQMRFGVFFNFFCQINFKPAVCVEPKASFFTAFWGIAGGSSGPSSSSSDWLLLDSAIFSYILSASFFASCNKIVKRFQLLTVREHVIQYNYYDPKKKLSYSVCHLSRFPFMCFHILST